MSEHPNGIELNAGGLSCIRLCAPPPGFLAAVETEFGAGVWKAVASEQRPLIKVTFEPVTPPGDAVFVGRSNAAKGEMMYVCEAGEWAEIPLGKLLDRMPEFKIRASPGYDPIRLVGYVLEPLMRVRALTCGHAFVHSSAVVLDDRAYLLSAWGNTGKTNLLLHFWNNGGGMLSDDWTLVRADGRIAGYPRPVNLMNYNLDAYPELRARLGAKRRLVYGMDRLFRRMRPSIVRLGGTALRGADLLGRLLEMAANSRLPLGGFEGGAHDTALPAAAILEVHKIEANRDPQLIPLDRHRMSAAAAVCFMHEHQRLVQLLHEHSYGSRADDDLVGKIQALYAETLSQCLQAAGAAGTWSLGMPVRANHHQLAQCAALIRGLAATHQQCQTEP